MDFFSKCDQIRSKLDQGKDGPSKICRRQPLKNLKGYGLLKLYSTNFAWSILEYFVPYNGLLLICGGKKKDPKEKVLL